MVSARITSWLREPLLHFLVLGGLIFAIDHVVSAREDNARVIVIDDALTGTLATLFEEGRGRMPTDEELSPLVYRWLQNEVLYREALALGLDQGDEMIRERMILKMRMLVFNDVAVDEPDEARLRRWFEANRARYDIPQRYDFVQFRVPGSDTDARASAGRLADRLPADDVPDQFSQDVRQYRGRTRANIATMFGDDFAAAFDGEPVNGWQALPSDEGWHIARVTAVHDPVPASFESLKPRIAADWRQQQSRAQVLEALKEMREKYEIRWEIAP